MDGDSCIHEVISISGSNNGNSSDNNNNGCGSITGTLTSKLTGGNVMV